MARLLNCCLLLTSPLGYLKWGGGHSAFLAQVEFELVAKLFKEPSSLLHPFVLLPLAGQLILLFTLFQNKPGKILSLAGMACLSLIMLMILLIGLLSLDYKIIFSALPFIITGILVLLYYRRPRKAQGTLR